MVNRKKKKNKSFPFLPTDISSLIPRIDESEHILGDKGRTKCTLKARKNEASCNESTFHDLEAVLGNGTDFLYNDY